MREKLIRYTSLLKVTALASGLTMAPMAHAEGVKEVEGIKCDITEEVEGKEYKSTLNYIAGENGNGDKLKAELTRDNTGYKEHVLVDGGSLLIYEWSKSRPMVKVSGLRPEMGKPGSLRSFLEIATAPVGNNTAVCDGNAKIREDLFLPPTPNQPQKPKFGI